MQNIYWMENVTDFSKNMEEEWNWGRYYEAYRNVISLMGRPPRSCFIPPEYNIDAQKFKSIYDSSIGMAMRESMTLVIPQQVPSFCEMNWKTPRLPPFQSVLQHATKQMANKTKDIIEEEKSTSAPSSSPPDVNVISTNNSYPRRESVQILNDTYDTLFGNETLILFFSKRSPLGVDPIDHILIYAQYIKAGRIILIADNPNNPEEPVNHFARDKLRRMNVTHPNLHFQYFSLSTMTYKMDCRMCDKFEVLSTQQRAAFFNDNPNYKPENMSVMRFDDIGRMLYDIKLGDVVKTYNSNGAATFLLVVLDK